MRGKAKTRSYVDDWGDHQPTLSMYVSEETKVARVTYRGEDGKPFRVNIVQKPNPIGFTARLPGR